MFCSKCGFQMEEGTSFCPKCGTSVAIGAVPTTSRLALGDFLAMSPEYQKMKDKKKMEETKKGLLWAGAMFGCMGLGIVLSLILLSTVLLVLGFVGTFLFIIPIVRMERKLERELNDYGAQLYKEYLEKNGFPTV